MFKWWIFLAVLASLALLLFFVSLALERWLSSFDKKDVKKDE